MEDVTPDDSTQVDQQRVDDHNAIVKIADDIDALATDVKAMVNRTSERIDDLEDDSSNIIK